MSEPAPIAAFAEVAVPLPLTGTLTYSVPASLAPLARPGSRVRVAVGKRRLTGMVVALRETAPAGVEARPLDAVLDLEPVLPADLLELTSFVADYYFAPIGEVLRSMLPSALPPWGDRRVWLTDAGALAPARSEDERAVLETLREAGRMRLAELQARLGLRDLGRVVETLRSGGRLVVAEEEHESGARYVTAVDRAPGELAAQIAASGRSAAGRSVLEYLSAQGRPATLAELEDELGASAAVVRRLVGKGLLRRFTQVDRLDLDRHLLAAQAAATIEPRADQAAAIAALCDAVSGRSFRGFLLVGPTGSGKTEVYLRAAQQALTLGRSAILLVPEIALVPALAGEARRRFGPELALLHSALASQERHQEWERIRSGQARVVLGPRSAVFAPLRDVGLIVVDEEQDPAYKQETVPRYHGRDLALVRGKASGAAVVLVSATPSFEARWNRERGKLTGLALTTRAGRAACRRGSWSTCAEKRTSARSERSASRRGCSKRCAHLRARRTGDPAAQSARLRPGAAVPGLRRRHALRRLRPAADLPSQAGAPGLSLLRLAGAGAGALPVVRRSGPRADRRRHRAGGGALSRALPAASRSTSSTATRSAGSAAPRPSSSASRAARCRPWSAPRWYRRGITFRASPSPRCWPPTATSAFPTSAPSSAPTRCSPRWRAAPAAARLPAGW